MFMPRLIQMLVMVSVKYIFCNRPKSDLDCLAHNGTYLFDCHAADPWTETVKPWATSPVEAERLWKLSERLVGQEFHY